MATISNPSLTIQNVNATTVNVTVRYTLTPSNIEKLAGTVFSEQIQLIGDDPISPDTVIFTFADSPYSASTAAPTITRTRSRTILKSNLNEDDDFATTGAELVDEILARIKVTYAASAPTVPELPPTTATNTISGAWK